MHNGQRPIWPALRAPERRGAKTKATVKIQDISTGAPEELNPLATLQDGQSYPTVVQQARNNMRKYADCVLLTRVGSFYELYFEQASNYGPLLNLKVAQKVTAAGDVPMVTLLYPIPSDLTT